MLRSEEEEAALREDDRLHCDGPQSNTTPAPDRRPLAVHGEPERSRFGRRRVSGGVERSRCAVARCAVTICDFPHLLGSLPNPGASQLACGQALTSYGRSLLFSFPGVQAMLAGALADSHEMVTGC